jgi:hypothetical protein
VVGAPCIILDVEMELLQVCGPLLMAVILQFSLCLHELQRLMISVDDCLLPLWGHFEGLNEGFLR